jgi:hypothetical protein
LDDYFNRIRVAAVELARSFTPLNQTQMAALEAKVEPVAKQAYFSGSCLAGKWRA